MQLDWIKLIALVLIVEAIGPFLFPQKWQKYLAQMARMPTEHLRMVGAILLATGTIILWLAG
ncbi:DUF2065 domain-containing protein [Gayadomonas joobiniege]|uniref:DUF2065 domain-containing protein n=1 Tax=Gayadomonas joobiniege TaxID=1234606 RepID=UPI00035C9EDD|nr:DUF2065 domain-containing protein [Gayadomonas joobiniege]